MERKEVKDTHTGLVSSTGTLCVCCDIRVMFIRNMIHDHCAGSAGSVEHGRCNVFVRGRQTSLCIMGIGCGSIGIDRYCSTSLML